MSSLGDSSQIDLTIVILRGIVLIIAAIGGVLSIFLGWKLYRDGMLSSVSGEATDGRGLNFKLTSAGPGVFFALFGMWLLVHLADKEVVLGDNEATQQQTAAPTNAPTSLTPVDDRNSSLQPISALFRSQTQQNPPVCIVRTRLRRFFGGDYVTAANVNADLDFSIEMLRSKAADPVRRTHPSDLSNALATLEWLRGGVEQWPSD